jgi:hypothetical protein
MARGRPKRDTVFETARTKAWYFSVRRALAQKHQIAEHELNPLRVRELIDPTEESNIWHKYSLGEHSPTHTTQFKDADGNVLKTVEWVDQSCPGTANIYWNGPARLWEIKDVWSISEANKMLQRIESAITSELIPIEDLVSEDTYSQSEAWFSVPQLRLYWKSEQISITASQGKPHLSMLAIAYGVACTRFMDWYSPLFRTLESDECMAWVKQNYGLDLLDFCFTEEISQLPNVIAAKEHAGIPTDFKLIIG